MNWSIAIFGALPYIALAVFVVGHIWRWRTDQIGWGTRTSQMFERKILRWGSPLFHFGALFVILGHAGGMLIPASWTEAVGISEDMYHKVAVTAGVIAGSVMCAGLILLIVRRFMTGARMRIVTNGWDIVVYVLLTVEAALGMYMTLAINVFGEGTNYRESVAVWFRSIFYLNPNLDAVSTAPVLYQVHAILAFAILAVWPFTRLVHVWSVPLGYLTRPYVVYRDAKERTPAGINQ